MEKDWKMSETYWHFPEPIRNSFGILILNNDLSSQHGLELHGDHIAHHPVLSLHPLCDERHALVT